LSSYLKQQHIISCPHLRFGAHRRADHGAASLDGASIVLCRPAIPSCVLLGGWGRCMVCLRKCHRSRVAEGKRRKEERGRGGERRDRLFTRVYPT